MFRSMKEIRADHGKRIFESAGVIKKGMISLSFVYQHLDHACTYDLGYGNPVL